MALGLSTFAIDPELDTMAGFRSSSSLNPDNNLTIDTELDAMAGLTKPVRQVQSPPPQRSVLMDIPTAVVAGAADAAEQYARAVRMGDIVDPEEVKKNPLGHFANWIILNKEQFEKNNPYLFAPTKDEGFIRRSVREGVRSTVPSLAAGLPAAIAGGAIAGPVGLVTGYALSGGTIFGLAEYDQFVQDVMEHNKKNPDNQIPKEVWKPEAIKSAFIEGGLEGVSDLVQATSFGFGKLGTTPLKTTVREILKQGFKGGAKNFLVAQARTQPAEILTEMGQNSFETMIRQGIGLETPQSPGEAALSAIGPTFVSTLLIGAGAHTLQAKQRSNIVKAIVNPEVEFDTRFDAMKVVYDELQKTDKVNNTSLARKWGEVAQHYLLKGEAINIDQDVSTMKSLEDIFVTEKKDQEVQRDITKFDERQQPKVELPEIDPERPETDKIVRQTLGLETYALIHNNLVEKGFSEDRAKELASQVMGARAPEDKIIKPIEQSPILDQFGKPIEKDISTETPSETSKLSNGQLIINKLPEDLQKQLILTSKGNLFSSPGSTKIIIKKSGLEATHVPFEIAPKEFVGLPKLLAEQLLTDKIKKDTPVIVAPQPVQPIKQEGPRIILPGQQFTPKEIVTPQGTPVTPKPVEKSPKVQLQETNKAIKILEDQGLIESPQYKQLKELATNLETQVIKKEEKPKSVSQLLTGKHEEYKEAIAKSPQEALTKTEEILKILDDEGHSETAPYKVYQKRKASLQKQIEQREKKDEDKDEKRVATKEQIKREEPKQTEPIKGRSRKAREAGPVVQERSKTPKPETEGKKLRGKAQEKVIIEVKQKETPKEKVEKIQANTVIKRLEAGEDVPDAQVNKFKTVALRWTRNPETNKWEHHEPEYKAAVTKGVTTIREETTKDNQVKAIKKEFDSTYKKFETLKKQLKSEKNETKQETLISEINLLKVDLNTLTERLDKVDTGNVKIDYFGEEVTEEPIVEGKTPVKKETKAQGITKDELYQTPKENSTSIDQYTVLEPDTGQRMLRKGEPETLFQGLVAMMNYSLHNNDNSINLQMVSKFLDQFKDNLENGNLDVQLGGNREVIEAFKEDIRQGKQFLQKVIKEQAIKQGKSAKNKEAFVKDERPQFAKIFKFELKIPWKNRKGAIASRFPTGITIGDIFVEGDNKHENNWMATVNGHDLDIHHGLWVIGKEKGYKSIDAERYNATLDGESLGLFKTEKEAKEAFLTSENTKILRSERIIEPIVKKTKPISKQTKEGALDINVQRMSNIEKEVRENELSKDTLYYMTDGDPNEILKNGFIVPDDTGKIIITTYPQGFGKHLIELNVDDKFKNSLFPEPEDLGNLDKSIANNRKEREKLFNEHEEGAPFLYIGDSIPLSYVKEFGPNEDMFDDDNPPFEPEEYKPINDKLTEFKGKVKDSYNFSRTSDTGTGVTEQQANEIIDRVTESWPSAPIVIKFNNRSELPENIITEIAKDPKESRIGGFYYDNKVFLILDELKDQKDTERVLIHEMVGHAGIKNTFGNEIKPLLRSIYNEYRGHEDMDEVRKHYTFNERSEDGQADYGGEFLAYRAENNLGEPTFWDKVYNEIRKIARKLGLLNIDSWSDSEIKQLLSDSRRFLSQPSPVTQNLNDYMTAFNKSNIAPTFYSKLIQTIKERLDMPNKPGSLMNWLNKYVKPEELKWMGVKQYLEGKVKIDKDDFLKFLESNQIEVQEKFKQGDGYDQENDSPYAYQDDNGSWYGAIEAFDGDLVEASDENFNTEDEALQWAIDKIGSIPEGTRHSSPNLNIPGGENYRELLLIWNPENKKPNRFYYTMDHNPDGSAVPYIHDREKVTNKTGAYANTIEDSEFDTDQEAAEWAQQRVKELEKENGITDVTQNLYSSPHWDEANVLGHVRFDERTDDQGRKILFIQEIQSDWLQTAKRVGFKENNSRYDELASKYNSLQITKDTWVNDALNESHRLHTNTGQNWQYFSTKFDETEQGKEHGKELLLVNEEMKSLSEQGKDSTVPRAPFLENWHEVFMKRILRYATDNNFDGVAWTTGQQQSDRYNLSNVIDELEITKNKGEFNYKLIGKKESNEVISVVITGKNELERTIGDELAEKAINDLAKTNSIVYTGDNLKLPKKGMIVFYDERLKRFTEKYIKQWGGKLEEINFDTINFAELTWEEKYDGKKYVAYANEDQFYTVDEPLNKPGEWFVSFQGDSDLGRDLGTFSTAKEAMTIAEKDFNKNVKGNLRQPGLILPEQMKKDVVEKGQPWFAKNLPQDYQAEADKLGLIFNGMQERPGGKSAIPLFTDKKTGSTFTTTPGETIEQALDKNRSNFSETPKFARTVKQQKEQFVYHGSLFTFNEFDDNKLGKNNNYPDNTVHWFSFDKQLASKFAEGRQIEEYQYIVETDEFTNWFNEKYPDKNLYLDFRFNQRDKLAEDFLKEKNEPKAQVYKVKVDSDNLMSFDAINLDEFNMVYKYAEIIEEAKLKGYDGVYIKNSPFSFGTRVRRTNLIGIFTGKQVKIIDQRDFDKIKETPKFARIVDFKDVTPDSDPRAIKDLFSEQSRAILKTLSMQLPKNLPSMHWTEKYLLSPEWYQHPVIQKIVDAAINRHDDYYELFNTLNELPGKDTIIDLNIQLKHKDLSAVQRLKNESSKEYKEFEKIVDEGDTLEWKKQYGSTPVTYEEHLEKTGVNKELRDLYHIHRQSYDKALDLLLTPMSKLVKDIEDNATKNNEKPKYPSFQTFDDNGEKVTINLKQVIQQMGQLRGTYAPRLREYGDYVVKGNRNGKQVRYHKSNRLTAELLKKELERKGYTIEPIHEREKLQEDIYSTLRVVNTAKAIEVAMKNSDVNDPELQIKFHEELLQQMADLIRIRGFRSSMVARKHGEVIGGYITDPNERFVRYINNISAGIAKARASEKMFKLLAGQFEGEGKDKKKVGGIDPEKEHRAYSTATKYIEEQLRNIDAADRVVGLIKSFATFKYLGFNARSPIINILSLVTTVPTAIHQYALNGKGSLLKIHKELASASIDYGKVMKGDQLEDKDEQKFIDEIHLKGYDTPQYTRDALGTIESAYNKAWARTMYWSMYIFGKSEQWIRGTTMLTAYRMIKENEPNLTERETIERAHDVSDKAHGVYGKSTMIAAGQGTGPGAKLAQILYTYQKFPHNYLQMLYDVGVRKGNIKGFVFGLLAPVMIGGAAVWPFKDVLLGIAKTMLHLVGVDWDPEKAFWDWVREKFGSKTEIIGRHGALGAVGVDVSSSMSIGAGVPKNFYELFGVGGGILKDYQDAKHFFDIEQYSRATEKALPVSIGNIFKAIRELNGVTTTKGQRVWDENGEPYIPSGIETGLRTVGFRSAKEATMAERTWEVKREVQNFTNKRNKIYEEFRNYIIDKGSSEDLQGIMDDITKYNDTIVKHNKTGEISFITKDTLKAQVKSLSKPSKSMYTGLYAQ